MSSFFKHFPTTQRILRVNNPFSLVQQQLTLQIADFFRNVDVDALSIQKYTNYQFYEIQDGERPDVVSQKLYGTPDYYWTFFVVNDFLRGGLQSWPQSQNELDRMLELSLDPWTVFGMNPIYEENTYTYPDDEGEPISVEFTERKNDFLGLSFDETVRLYFPTNPAVGYEVFYDSDRNQLWVKRSGMQLNQPFYLASSNAEWNATYLRWVETNREGFFNYSLEGPVAFTSPDQIIYNLASVPTNERYLLGSAAPYRYLNVDGKEVLSFDYFRDGGSTVSYRDALTEDNFSRRKIRVIQPIYILNFVKEYRAIIKT